MRLSNRFKNGRTGRAMRLLAAAGMSVLLVARTGIALESASDALSMWWTRVLPALFPFYVVVSILFRLGAFTRAAALTASPLPPCFLFGALAGYPTGARLAGLMGAPWLGQTVNVCGIMFLKGVVANGMLRRPELFWPIGLAHYSSALLSAPFLIKRPPADTPPVPSAGPEAEKGSLFTDIGDGMLMMLRIGGGMIFFSVFSAIMLDLFFRDAHPLIRAVLTGLVEITKGCRDLSLLDLSPRLQAGLSAALLSFGGVCVLAQAKMVSPGLDTAAYFVCKLAQGCAAGILAYLMTPWFLEPSIAAMTLPAEQYLDNALTCAAFLLCACAGLAASVLFGAVVSARRTRRGRKAASAGG